MDEKGALADLFNQSGVSPVEKVEEKVEATTSKPTTSTEVGASLVDAVVSEFKLVHDKLHEELAALRQDRTEDNIGLKDPYWNKLNELRMHIHNNK